MKNIHPIFPGPQKVSPFHLSHVRSLIRCPSEFGGATDRVQDAEFIDELRVAGRVTVILPGGQVSSSVAFEARNGDDVPSRHLVHGVLNGLTYWFRCSESLAAQHGSPCFRVYFAYGGTWFLFYTQGSALQFGAEVFFERREQSSAWSEARAA